MISSARRVRLELEVLAGTITGNEPAFSCIFLATADRTRPPVQLPRADVLGGLAKIAADYGSVSGKKAWMAMACPVVPRTIQKANLSRTFIS
jgi:hypothetical protein